MDIYLQNTLTGKKEKFVPIETGKVSMYNCGPTVYDYAHIGNFRTFILNDLLRRMFEYNGLQVKQVMNVTDVDDKTIRRSQEEHIQLSELTQKYEKLFFEDLRSLNIELPEKSPRATENISGMIALIEKLLEKGIAYKSSDGIYFDISRSKGYGKLANLNLNQETKERIVNDEYDKENPRDFSLWKFHTPEDGDVSYDASFGKGRPGWHIECSAMSMKELGETIDVHTGGQDLIFPHHTNEIAQSEGVTEKPFVHYWVHGGFITVDNRKMSKSLGNIVTLENLREKGIDPMAFRYFVLGTHYSSPLNFIWEAVKGAQNALRRLRERVRELKEESDEKYREELNRLINGDLDTPKALALIWEMAKEDKNKDLILDFDKVLGLKLNEVEEIKIPEEVQRLIDKRNMARSEKDFTRSDELRIEIESHGFKVMDTSEGTTVIKE